MKDGIAGIYDVALTMLPGIGPKSIRLLMPHFGTAENIFNQPLSKLMKVPGIGMQTAIKLRDKSVIKKAQEEIEKATERGLRIICISNPEYPKYLADCHDAPVLLYYIGQEILDHPRAIAIVGSRKATEYGKSMVNEFIAEWKKLDIMVVSGLAYGIDIEAHRAALKHDIPTLGVLGSGLGWIYPALHKKTVEEMKEKGGILSEFPYLTKPDAENFPQRNRVVAGMSQVTIVIEAAEKGGALITAGIADSYNKEVMAMPGRVGDPMSKGCLQLIRDHKAHILTDPSDLPKLMGWEHEFAAKPQFRIFPDLNEEELKLVELLVQEGELSMDALSIKSGFTLNKVSSTLLGLELKNAVKAIPGKRYKANPFN